MKKTTNALADMLCAPGPPSAAQVIAAIDSGAVALDARRLVALRYLAATGNLTRQDVADAAHAAMLRRLPSDSAGTYRRR